MATSQQEKVPAQTQEGSEIGLDFDINIPIAPALTRSIQPQIIPPQPPTPQTASPQLQTPAYHQILPIPPFHTTPPHTILVNNRMSILVHPLTPGVDPLRIAFGPEEHLEDLSDSDSDKRVEVEMQNVQPITRGRTRI